MQSTNRSVITKCKISATPLHFSLQNEADDDDDGGGDDDDDGGGDDDDGGGDAYGTKNQSEITSSGQFLRVELTERTWKRNSVVMMMIPV